MVIDAPARTDAPAPSPGSWVASPPRDEWPCGDIIDEDRGLAARAITLFRYGDRTACHLPATLVERGITGCPESYTRTDPDGRVRTYALHYDPAGTMTQPDALPDAPPRTRVETFACPDDAAPVKLSFVRFDRAAKRQSVIVRAENPTAHVVYRIGWQTRYRDAEGNIVPFATNLGMMSHDDNS